MVVPVKNGGRVKVKLLEALGYGSLVISTSNGIKGTDFVPNEHLLIANIPEKYIEYCIEAINNPERFLNIRNTALKKMKNEYSWKTIVRNYENNLIEILKK